MKLKLLQKFARLVGLCILPLPLVAQAPNVIPLASEPHHHLVLHNDYVNVFDAKAAPGDSLLLHRHDRDAVAIAIGDQTVTVGVPGKPDVHSKNADGQVRMQASGYVHSTHVDGDAPYYTVAIELLHPQTGARNLCATVLAGQPLNCPEDRPDASATTHRSQPQYESAQTRIDIVRVLPHKDLKIERSPGPQLIVALDPAAIVRALGKKDQVLHPGDSAWFDQGSPASVLKNTGNKEARFVEMTFQPLSPHKN